MIRLALPRLAMVAVLLAFSAVGLAVEEIVAYREMFGNFHSVEELADVKGIGPATVEKNRQRIIVVNKEALFTRQSDR